MLKRAHSRCMPIVVTVLALGTALAVPVGSALAQTIVADSSTDWSATGTQGDGGWYHGYFNQTQDQLNDDGLYSEADFVSFLNDGTNTLSATNHWNGGGWKLSATEPPVMWARRAPSAVVGGGGTMT